MAYSNYGAFIWKNGKNITEECADLTYELVDGKFISTDWYEFLLERANDLKSDKTVEGHAVINFGDFLIAWYKTYNPIIFHLDGTSEELEMNIFDEVYGKIEKNDLYIFGSQLGHTPYGFYRIDYKEDKYCVIVGSGIGEGWEGTPASKYVLKHLIFTKRRDGSMFYRIETKYDVDSDIVFNKLDRMEDINHNKYWLRKYRKDFIIDLLTFRFKSLPYDFNNIQEYREKIKWLK